jgi:mannosyltransferase OCH1-like enzyme
MSLKSHIVLLLVAFAVVAFNLHALFRLEFDSSPFPITDFAVLETNGENHQARSNINITSSIIADTESKSKEKLTSKIPRRLIFTYKYDLLTTKYPSHLSNNVRNTIQVYADAWNLNVNQVDVLFLTDAQCTRFIAKVDPRLLNPFFTEPNGPYKADICRIAALYLFGGYYFDVDIQVIKALDPEPEVDFITANMVNNRSELSVVAFGPRCELDASKG